MFLKIQITGKGRIPRIGGIAPRMSPIKAEPDFIKLIMSTPGLGIRYYNPEENKFIPLTNKNIQAVLNMYGNWDYNKKPIVNTSPVVPEKKVAVPTKQPEVEVKDEKPITEKVIDTEVKVNETNTSEVTKEEIKTNNTIKPIYVEETSTKKVDIPDEDVPLKKKEEINKNNKTNKK